MLSLLLLSMLRRMLELLLRRLARRASSGSCGLRPLTLANRFRISVRLITPLSLPDRLAPGIADAEMAGAAAPESGDCDAIGVGIAAGSGVTGDEGTNTAGAMAGVGGPDDAGEGASTTHIRWERVATSLATVCARVEYGLTWKTGNESWPSLTPRSLRITLMKWIHDERSKGRDVDLVSNWPILAQGHIGRNEIDLLERQYVKCSQSHCSDCPRLVEMIHPRCA
jgi:hypothetical protein